MEKNYNLKSFIDKFDNLEKYFKDSGKQTKKEFLKDVFDYNSEYSSTKIEYIKRMMKINMDEDDVESVHLYSEYADKLDKLNLIFCRGLLNKYEDKLNSSDINMFINNLLDSSDSLNLNATKTLPEKYIEQMIGGTMKIGKQILYTDLETIYNNYKTIGDFFGFKDGEEVQVNYKYFGEKYIAYNSFRIKNIVIKDTKFKFLGKVRDAIRVLRDNQKVLNRQTIFIDDSCIENSNTFIMENGTRVSIDKEDSIDSLDKYKLDLGDISYICYGIK